MLRGVTWRDWLLAGAVWLLDAAFFSTAGSDLAQLGRADYSALLLLGLGLLGNAALLWRRLRPGWVFGVLWLFSVLGTLYISGYQPVLGLLVALYSVGAHASRSWAWLILPATLSFAVVAANEAWIRRAQTNPVTTFVGLTVFYGLLSCGVWGLGHFAGRSRRRLAEAAAAERQRLSRELHDIVAHTVTVMVLQAAGAQKIVEADPRRAGVALGQITELGRQAMGELRRMLAVQGLPPGGAEPAAGVSDVDDLVRGMRQAGLPVELTVVGQARPVDPSVGLAAYRAVQEALTNAAKHSGAATTVCLDWTEGLRVTVENARGKPAGGLSAGRGLPGLRERVTVVGGRMEVGATEGGGFHLTVRLPAGG